MEALSTRAHALNMAMLSAQWEDWGILRRSQRCWARNIPSPEFPPPGMGAPRLHRRWLGPRRASPACLWACSRSQRGCTETRERNSWRGRKTQAFHDRAAGGGGPLSQRRALRMKRESALFLFRRSRLSQPAGWGPPRPPAVGQAGLHQEFPLSAHPPAPSGRHPGGAGDAAGGLRGGEAAVPRSLAWPQR